MINIDKLDQILDEYENVLGLNQYTANKHADTKQYLDMTRQELEALSPEDCGQISFMLHQYVFHLQRTCNRENTRIKWADSLLKKSLAEDTNNLKSSSYSPYEERLMLAIKQSDYASKLFDIKIRAQNRLSRINFLPNYVQNIANTLIQIQQSKLRGKRNG